MATVPEGYVELDLVGFTDKGTYSSSETYVKNDLVHNDNKIYLSLQDDNIGQALPSSTETENTYWKVWLAGSADDLANITVKDTSNVTGGGANKVVVAQNLIDAIANKVIQNMNSITQLNSNLSGIVSGSLTLSYINSTTMWGESDVLPVNKYGIGIPVCSVAIVDGTPYENVEEISVRINESNKIEVSARGSGFVSGHQLRINYICK